MGCTGESPATCPAGTVGTPYSLPVFLQDDDPWSCAVFRVSSGTFPPGLSLTPYASDSTKGGLISGTPTQPGTYRFYISYTASREASCGATCGNKCQSDDEFIIPINPGAGAPPPPSEAHARAGDDDAGDDRDAVLPADDGVRVRREDVVDQQRRASAGPRDRRFDGPHLRHADDGRHLSTSPSTRRSTPTRARIRRRSQIVVRDPLRISAGEPFTVGTPRPRARSECRSTRRSLRRAGFGTYAWTVSTGTLPPGLELAERGDLGNADGRGQLRLHRDRSGRRGSHGELHRLGSSSPRSSRSRPRSSAREGRQALRGEAEDVRRRQARRPGGSPRDSCRGRPLHAVLGVLAGTPKKAGRYRVTFEATDALGVVSDAPT